MKNLELARNEKGAMSSKNLSYVINRKSDNFDLDSAIVNAIRANALSYLNPPIKNFNFKGILKTSLEIKKWFESSADVKRDFQTTAMMMERAGTGGSLFRNLYKDFLKEAGEILKSKEIIEVHKIFTDVAEKWKTVSELFHKAGETEDIVYINQASEILVDLSHQEKSAMENLLMIIETKKK